MGELIMYEKITQREFRDRMDELIISTKTTALYAIDMLYPLLEDGFDKEALPYLYGHGSVTDTLLILHNNIDMRVKDDLLSIDTDLVYFIDENGMPSKTSPEQYELIIKGKPMHDIDYDEPPYTDIPENPDNVKMFA